MSSVTKQQQGFRVPGVPDGWELVRIGYALKGEYILESGGRVVQFTHERAEYMFPILRKIEKTKRYRPFANAEEFKPHRDRWVRRSYNGRDGAKGAFRPFAYDQSKVWDSLGVESYTKMFEDGRVFDDDGSPFGVEVVE